MKAVELLRSHTHAGVEHPAGVTLTVSPATADYLEEHGIGRKVSARAVSQTPSKKRTHKGGSSS